MGGINNKINSLTSAFLSLSIFVLPTIRGLLLEVPRHGNLSNFDITTLRNSLKNAISHIGGICSLAPFSLIGSIYN